jgi:hypothetical protein
VDVPVTAQVGDARSLGGKLTGMFGASVFGPAIVRVRNVQNSITQHLLESAFVSHLKMMQDGDAGLGATLLHSPLALGRRTAQAVLDTAQQIYGRLDAVAGNAQVMVPSELALNAGPLDNQALLERLAAFTDGSGSDFEYVQMTLRQAQQRRAALGRIAAHASNDTDAMLAGAKTRAYDRAITDSLSAFDSSAEGQRALKLINLKSASAAYRQASALWGDGSAISRVTEKFNSALGMPTEAVDAATDPNKVLWNFQSLQRVVNDPKNLPDLIRTFGTERNVRQFRQMVSLAAEDGGRSYNRLAGGVGSLFLGNYPLYRGVWTAASGNVSGMGTVAVMMAGYKMLADLATMRGGPALIANALGALRMGKDVTKTGAVLALAAKAARAGFAQSGLGPAGGSAPQPSSPGLPSPSAPAAPAAPPAAPAPGQPGLP